MTVDRRIRVDQFFAAEKTLEGSWGWYLSERTDAYNFRREIAEDGVSHGFYLKVIAHMNTNPREFRFLIMGLDACVFRLDCAPMTDPEHVNGPKRPMGWPMSITGIHYHPWPENRMFSTASAIHKHLPYAIDSNAKIDNIGQGFWQLCDLTGISATSADEPDWPKTNELF